MISEYIRKIKKNELVRGSLVLLLFVNIFNFLNYFYQFLMARMLNISNYGILVALMNLAYILSVSSDSIQLISSKYASELSSEGKLGKLKSLMKSMTKRAIKLSFIVYSLFILVAIFLSWFWNKSLLLLLFTGLLIFPIFIAPINRGVMQGRKKFTSLGISLVIESLSKIIFAIIFVLIGFAVYGAIGAVILGLIVSTVISFIFVKDIIREKSEEVFIEEKYSYSFSVFFALSIVMFMFAFDVIVAVRFFSEQTLGLYAVASLLGKIIFFALLPISKAMFPLITNKTENSKKTWYNALKINFLIGLIAVLFFYFFPEIIIKILFGSKYLEIANLLWMTGLAFWILSFANTNIHYLISNSTKKSTIGFYLILSLFPIIEIVSVFLFHKTLQEFLIALISSFIILAVGTFFMIKRSIKNEKA